MLIYTKEERHIASPMQPYVLKHQSETVNKQTVTTLFISNHFYTINAYVGI